jgi:hypothetical protein
LCFIGLAIFVAASRHGAGANWDPRQSHLKILIGAVPAILKSQDQTTGRFGSQPWICDDQNVIFPLAAAWAIQDPANPYYHRATLLNAIMKGGDALVAGQDNRGLWTFRKKDNSTWGQTAQPWTYSRWIRAFRLIQDAMPAERCKHWEKGLQLGFDRIARALPSTHSHNKPCHLAMALYCAGQCFGREDWKQVARAFMAKVVAAQSPEGYWSEHSGPTVVEYNPVYVEAIGVYYAMSQDSAVLDALRRAAVFHATFTYPDGSAVETVDERNPFHGGVCRGNVGFSFTPEGRGYLLRQSKYPGKWSSADMAADFLLYGATGPATPVNADRDENLTVVGNTAL